MVTTLAALGNMMTSLPGRKPTIVVSVAGSVLPAATVLSCSLDHGYDSISSAASITLSAKPWWLREPLNQEVIVRLGYAGYTLPRFTGYLETIQSGLWPNTYELRASGRMRWLQYDSSDDYSISSLTDVEIVGELLELSGIGAAYRNISGEDPAHDFGTTVTFVIPEGSQFWGVVNRLDEITGCVTMDGPDGVVVRLPLNPGIPSATAAWAYAAGDWFSLTRPLSKAEVRNKAIVSGLVSEAGVVPAAGAQAYSAYLGYLPDGTTPRYVPYTLEDDFIEDATYCQTVADRQMLKRNRLPDKLTLVAPGNPLVRAGSTVSVYEPDLDIDVATNYYIVHVHEEFDASGYTMTQSLEGGIGDGGYQLRSPVAAFTVLCDLEVVGGSDTYTVICDGSPSYDPDGDSADLTFAWSNDQTADSGTEMVYSFQATPAEIAAGLNVTLIVTDADTLSGTATRLVEGTSTTTLARVVFSAAGSQARCTQDGGRNWNYWAPGGGVEVISTPEGSYEDEGLFGLSDGRLVHTLDYLQSAPTTLETFDAAVNSIWVHETQDGRITVGLANGKLYLSTDGGTTWTLLYTFAAAITCVKESPMLMGQFWVTSGVYQYIFYEGASAPTVQATFPATSVARWTANSFMGNYACATIPAASGAAAVRGADDDSALAFPDMTPGDPVEDVRALTHHLYLDILWACDLAGRFFVKAEGATTFAHVADMTAPGDVHHMLRDTALQNLIYVQAAEGLYKTPDGGNTFLLLDDYTAAGLVGYQVGLGSLRLRVSTGRRVYVAGRLSMTLGGIAAAYTDNIWAASPTWVDISTGLPTTGAPTIPEFELDSVDRNTGYMLVTAEPTVLYANTDLRGVGSWAVVLDGDDIETLTGRTRYDGGHTMVGLSTTPYPSPTGTVGVAVRFWDAGDLSPHNYVITSTDQGATWTATEIAEGLTPRTYWSVQDLVLGQHDGRYYVTFSRLAVLTRIYTSPTAYYEQATTSSTWFALIWPGAENINDHFCLFATQGGEGARTVNGWSSASAFGAAGILPVFAPDGQVVGGYTPGDLEVYRSTDGGDSFTETTAFGGGLSVKDLVALDGAHWYLAGAMGARTCTDNDLATWTDRNGDINTIIEGGKYQIAVDPEV